MDKDTLGAYFAFFSEIGIINQLSTAAFQSRLPSGLLISHFSVLNHLIRVRDGQTPLALANAFQVPKTTMTHTLSGLDKHRFIEFRKHPKDGRSKCVWITDAGRSFREEAIASLAPDLKALAEAIPVSTIQRLLPDLAIIRTHLDAARNENE